MRNIGSDGLCGNDSLDARSFGGLNDFLDTLLEAIWKLVTIEIAIRNSLRKG
jgi:hypothetical protein